MTTEAPEKNAAPKRAAFTSEQENRLAGARLRVVSDKSNPRPYYSRALMALSRPIPVEDPTGQFKTMGVDDRWRLYVAPSFVDECDSATLAAALVHELNHLLRIHADRAELAGVTPETHRLWNIAGDCEINPDIMSEGFMLPDWALTPEKIGADEGQMAEVYYQHLLKNQPPMDESDGAGAAGDESPGDCGSCAGGPTRGHEDSSGDSDGSGSGEKGLDPSHGEVLRRQVARDITNHAKQKGRGSVPGGLLRWATDLLEPKIDWRKTLSSMIRNAAALAAGKTDYTYTRMSRRSTNRTIFPALRSPVPEIAVVVDTSGSMSDDDVGAALAEVEGILKQIGCGSGAISVLTVDAAAHGVQRVTTAKRVEVRGGGGTDMRVGIEDAVKLRPRPNVVVVLTDGWTPWPDVPPSIPVVAGIITGAGYGEVTPDTFSIPEWMPSVLITHD